MIFGNRSISTYSKTNLSIWIALAFQGGLLNIGGFLACHAFVSHVTGYATLFGAEAGKSNWAEAIGLTVLPIFFLLGAMLSGFLVDARLRMGKDPKYYIVFGVLFLSILALEVGGYNKMWGTFAEPRRYLRDYALLALMGAICGLQNATVSLVSKSVVRTTHLTGIVTDLGIGIARSLTRVADQSDNKANFMRVGIVIAFALGGLIGFQVFIRWEFRGFLFPCLISGSLFFIALYFQVLKPYWQAHTKLAKS